MGTAGYCRSLTSHSKVLLNDGDATVTTIGLVETRQPVCVTFGPLILGLTIEQATDLGNEILRAAHHWQAARAEFIASQEAEQAATVPA